MERHVRLYQRSTMLSPVVFDAEGRMDGRMRKVYKGRFISSQRICRIVFQYQAHYNKVEESTLRAQHLLV